jgi:hypothetical protein
VQGPGAERHVRVLDGGGQGGGEEEMMSGAADGTKIQLTYLTFLLVNIFAFKK